MPRIAKAKKPVASKRSPFAERDELINSLTTKNRYLTMKALAMSSRNEQMQEVIISSLASIGQAALELYGPLPNGDLPNIGEFSDISDSLDS